QAGDVQVSQTNPIRTPQRARRTGPTGTQPLETTPRDPGLLRRRRLERPRRSHQRPPGAPPRHRPGIPQPQPLHPAIPDPLRPTPTPDQRTLNPEEPANCPEKPRNYGSLRLLARLTLEELQRAFDELEDHPVRGTQERDVEPVDLGAGQRAPHRVAAPLDPVGHGGQGLLDVL